jgi:hypothetical protein
MPILLTDLIKKLPSDTQDRVKASKSSLIRGSERPFAARRGSA